MYPSPSKEFSDWDVFLDFIEERRVIPIIGSDLVRLSVDGESTTFDHYLAAELAERLGLPAAQAVGYASRTITPARHLMIAMDSRFHRKETARWGFGSSPCHAPKKVLGVSMPRLSV
ncbi:MAG: hypothetical protein ACREXX_08880 [Gammaproteobacteria bacterium]